MAEPEALGNGRDEKNRRSGSEKYVLIAIESQPGETPADGLALTRQEEEVARESVLLVARFAHY
jgi:hypothetical protein